MQTARKLFNHLGCGASFIRSLSIIVLACGSDAATAAEPIDIGSRKQLFIDARFIASSRGIELTMNAPVKMNQPVLASDTPMGG